MVLIMSTENIELVPLEYFKEASELGDTLKSDHSKIKNALQTKAALQSTVDKLSNLETYEITPALVTDTDKFLNEVVDKMNEESGDENLEQFSGTENFGLTLSPREWKQSRIDGCERLIEDIYKTIKRWANNLSDGFLNIFKMFNGTSISFQNRLEELELNLLKLSEENKIKEHVELNKSLVWALSVNGVVNGEYIVEDLNNNINILSAATKFLIDNETSVKNSIIRYFGNYLKAPYMPYTIKREIPKFFNVVTSDRTKPEYINGIYRGGFLGNTQIRVIGINPKEIDKLYKETDLVTGNKLYTDYLSECQTTIDVIESKQTPAQFKPSISKLITMLGGIRKLNAILDAVRSVDAPFNFDSNEIKDVANTLKTTGVVGENELKDAIKKGKVRSNPASAKEVVECEKALGIKFPSEYVNYLVNYGVISANSEEFYGLGISQDSYLNLLIAVPELRSNFNISKTLIPVLGIGNGDYYLYDTSNQTVLILDHSTGKLTDANMKLMDLVISNSLDIENYITPESLGELYLTVGGDYQFNIDKFKTEFCQYLIALISKLITVMSVGMECYDGNKID